MRYSMRTVVLAAAACLAVTPVALPASAATPAATSPANIIRNAGAEHATPLTDGSKVPVKYWHVRKRYYFTAVGYGSPAFPAQHSPGPTNRGKNFFAGGQTGTNSIGTQTDSLAKYATLIRSGNARYHLGGWFGGFSTQNDHANLVITWKASSGKSLGLVKIGNVLASQRHDKTGLLHRTASGTVPKWASSVHVTLHMVRTDGAYNDGYADNLRLYIAKT